MKYLLIASLVVLIACGKSDHPQHDDHGTSDPNTENPNQALYDQVMDIHDEVMPKMDDLFKYKQIIEEKIANTPGMVEAKKKELQSMAIKLDSANNAMMVWMHGFNPLPDSVDQEKAREYLETQMESIRKVRELTLETIEKAKTELNKP